MQVLVSDLQKGVSLKTTAPQQRNDRSEANLALSGADVLEDEAMAASGLRILHCRVAVKRNAGHNRSTGSA